MFLTEPVCWNLAIIRVIAERLIQTSSLFSCWSKISLIKRYNSFSGVDVNFRHSVLSSRTVGYDRKFGETGLVRFSCHGNIQNAES